MIAHLRLLVARLHLRLAELSLDRPWTAAASARLDKSLAALEALLDRKAP